MLTIQNNKKVNILKKKLIMIFEYFKLNRINKAEQKLFLKIYDYLNLGVNIFSYNILKSMQVQDNPKPFFKNLYQIKQTKSPKNQNQYFNEQKHTKKLQIQDFLKTQPKMRVFSKINTRHQEIHQNLSPIIRKDISPRFSLKNNKIVDKYVLPEFLKQKSSVHQHGLPKQISKQGKNTIYAHCYMYSKNFSVKQLNNLLPHNQFSKFQKSNSQIEGQQAKKLNKSLKKLTLNSKNPQILNEKFRQNNQQFNKTSILMSEDSQSINIQTPTFSINKYQRQLQNSNFSTNYSKTSRTINLQKQQIIQKIDNRQLIQIPSKQYIQNEKFWEKKANQYCQTLETLLQENSHHKEQIQRLIQQNKELIRKQQITVQNQQIIRQMKKQQQLLKKELQEKSVKCQALQQKNKELHNNIIKKNQTIISQQQNLKTHYMKCNKNQKLEGNQKKDLIIKHLLQYIKKQLIELQYYKGKSKQCKQNILKRLYTIKQDPSLDQCSLNQSITLNEQIYQECQFSPMENIQETKQKKYQENIFCQLANVLRDNYQMNYEYSNSQTFIDQLK